MDTTDNSASDRHEPCWRCDNRPPVKGGICEPCRERFRAHEKVLIEKWGPRPLELARSVLDELTPEFYGGEVRKHRQRENDKHQNALVALRKVAADLLYSVEGDQESAVGRYRSAWNAKARQIDALCDELWQEFRRRKPRATDGEPPPDGLKHFKVELVLAVLARAPKFDRDPTAWSHFARLSGIDPEGPTEAGRQRWRSVMARVAKAKSAKARAAKAPVHGL